MRALYVSKEGKYFNRGPYSICVGRFVLLIFCSCKKKLHDGHCPICTGWQNYKPNKFEIYM